MEFPRLSRSPLNQLRRNKLGGRFAASSLGWFHRFVLHRVIALATGKAVFVRTTISNRSVDEVSVRRRRRRSPFQRGRFPWIVVYFFAVLDAPEEINDERDLGETHYPGRPRDGRVPLKAGQSPNGVLSRNAPSLTTVIPAPMHSSHPLQKHGQEN